MIKYSEFKAIRDDFWVSYNYLISQKVPKGTIQNGISKFKKKEKGKWNHFIDSRELKTFFRLKDIPTQTFNKYSLVSEEEIIAFYGIDAVEVQEDRKFFEKKQTLTMIFTTIARNRWNHYTGYYQQFYPNTTLVNQLGATHGVIQEIITLRDKGYSYDLLYQAYSELSIEVNLYYRAKTFKSFCRKIKSCQLASIESVLPHKALNKVSNNLKLTEYWQNRIITLFANSIKRSKTEIKDIINKEREEKGLSSIEYTTVNNFLNNPEIKNIVTKSRHGRRKFRDELASYTTFKSEAINEIWEIDGLKIPFACKYQKQVLFLDLIIVVDVYSKRIIGHSIGKNENTEMIIRAIKNAIEEVKFVPKEIVHDKFSSYSSTQLEDLKYLMALVNVNWRSTNADSPREKGTIERIVGTLNTAHFRKLYGYFGEGIKAKRENSAPSPEAKVEFRKAPNLYSVDSIYVLVKSIIYDYNNNSEAGLPSPISKYDQSMSSKTKKNHTIISHEDFAFLFFENNQFKIKNSMITISRKKKRLTYTLPPELRNLLNGTKVKVYYDRSDYRIIHVYSARKEKEFYCSLNQDLIVPRLSTTWTDETKKYLEKRRQADRIHQDSISKFLEKAKASSLNKVKVDLMISKRFLLSGIDSKTDFKKVVTKDLINPNQNMDFSDDDDDDNSWNVIRKNLDDFS